MVIELSEENAQRVTAIATARGVSPTEVVDELVAGLRHQSPTIAIAESQDSFGAFFGCGDSGDPEWAGPIPACYAIHADRCCLYIPTTGEKPQMHALNRTHHRRLGTLRRASHPLRQPTSRHHRRIDHRDSRTAKPDRDRNNERPRFHRCPSSPLQSIHAPPRQRQPVLTIGSQGR